VNNPKYDGRLTAPLAEILLHKVAQGVERGREPEGRRGSIPAAALDAVDVLADVQALGATAAASEFEAQ
jgi:hypothetical protein